MVDQSHHGLTMVSISTTAHLFAPVHVGWRQVHENRLGWAGDLDPQLLEAQLHLPIEFTLNRPAAGVGAWDLSHNRCHRTIDLVYAPKFKVVANGTCNRDRDAFRRRCL